MAGTFGSRIRAARQRYGMTQTELAKRIGISKASLNQIERGKTPDPYASRIREVARVLQVDGNYLLGLTEQIDEKGSHSHEAYN
jgi:transcriptional regulator with XRE-family HTH domain